MSEPIEKTVRVELPTGTADLPLANPQAGPDTLAGWLRSHGFPLNTRCGERGLCHGCELELNAETVRACQLQPPSEPGVHIRIPARNLLAQAERATTDFVLHLPVGRAPLFGAGSEPYGAAFDIGTTTVDCLLVDLRTGAIAARTGGYNHQMEFGDNVLSRIEHASSAPANLRSLQDALVARSLAPLLREALDEAAADPGDLAGVALTGNTTLLHLLLGIDPAPLGIAPFTPVFLESRRGTVGSLRWPGLPANLPWQVLPGLGAYVGADITAGLFASGMVYRSDTCLLLDIGTNGEIVLHHEGRRLATATAAGPAFEGCGLRCGSRALAGTLSELHWNHAAQKFDALTLGGGSPSKANGICGTAYLDFLAEGSKAGILTERGRFEAAWWEAVTPAHKAPSEWGRAYRIVPDNDQTIVGEADVALLLQAKAAIAAGILTLLETCGIGPAAVHRLFIAGTFGRHVRTASLLGSGLLPGFASGQIEVIGNSALGGVFLALLDGSLLAEMDEVRASTDIIELNLTDSFEDHFLDALSLPTLSKESHHL